MMGDGNKCVPVKMSEYRKNRVPNGRHIGGSIRQQSTQVSRWMAAVFRAAVPFGK
jgi:hypothetical protein